MRLALAFWLLLQAACGSSDPVESPAKIVEVERIADCAVPDDHSSRCFSSTSCVACRFESLTLANPDGRRVLYGLPEGGAPKDGWPVALLFQGTLYGGDIMWASGVSEPFGGYFETELIAALLEAGYAVLTPETLGGGKTYWQTNVINKWDKWETTADHLMMLALLAAIADGAFGRLDAGRLHATGISSGGFMTSRMAIAYPGSFRSLAIQSGGFATFPLGPLPATLPADHPPTLFLHGSQDYMVPADVIADYYERLSAMGVDVRQEFDAVGHQWLPAAPRAVTDWFESH